QLSGDQLPTLVPRRASTGGEYFSSLLEPKGARPVTFEDCAHALRSIEAAGHPDHPAFTRTEVTHPELEQAHISVLQEAKLPRRR
ncbi:hypothetical protein, partial [Variovorax sp. N23]|uniref:hypothetical protein n=1 Tax=Variovorax sp. N23 TaxID=2980555 RepID=UPI0021C86CA9